MLDVIARLWRWLPGPVLGAALGYILWLPRDTAGCRLYRAGQATPTAAEWACTNLLGLDMWGSIDGGRLTPLVAALALGLLGLLLNVTYLARTE